MRVTRMLMFGDCLKELGANYRQAETWVVLEQDLQEPCTAYMKLYKTRNKVKKELKGEYKINLGTFIGVETGIVHLAAGERYYWTLILKDKTFRFVAHKDVCEDLKGLKHLFKHYTWNVTSVRSNQQDERFCLHVSDACLAITKSVHSTTYEHRWDWKEIHCISIYDLKISFTVCGNSRNSEYREYQCKSVSVAEGIARKVQEKKRMDNSTAENQYGPEPSRSRLAPPLPPQLVPLQRSQSWNKNVLVSRPVPLPPRSPRPGTPPTSSRSPSPSSHTNDTHDYHNIKKITSDSGRSSMCCQGLDESRYPSSPGNPFINIPSCTSPEVIDASNSHCSSTSVLSSGTNEIVKTKPGDTQNGLQKVGSPIISLVGRKVPSPPPTRVTPILLICPEALRQSGEQRTAPPLPPPVPKSPSVPKSPNSSQNPFASAINTASLYRSPPPLPSKQPSPSLQSSSSPQSASPSPEKRSSSIDFVIQMQSRSFIKMHSKEELMRRFQKFLSSVGEDEAADEGIYEQIRDEGKKEDYDNLKYNGEAKTSDYGNVSNHNIYQNETSESWNGDGMPNPVPVPPRRWADQIAPPIPPHFSKRSTWRTRSVIGEHRPRNDSLCSLLFRFQNSHNIVIDTMGMKESQWTAFIIRFSYGPTSSFGLTDWKGLAEYLNLSSRDIQVIENFSNSCGRSPAFFIMLYWQKMEHLEVKYTRVELLRILDELKREDLKEIVENTFSRLA